MSNDGLLPLLLTPFEERIAILRRVVNNLDIDAEVATLLRVDSADAIALAIDAMSVACEFEDLLLGRALELAARFADASSEDVRWSAAQLLASRDEPHVREQLSKFASDDDSDVRWQVAFGLPDQLATLDEISSEDPAIRALLALMTDSDDDIRQLATYGIATAPVLGPEIGNSLVYALQDADARVVDMALVGLARIDDPRAWPILLARIESNPSVVNLQAVAIAGLSEFCDKLASLRQISSGHDWEAALMAAIQACCGQ